MLEKMGGRCLIARDLREEMGVMMVDSFIPPRSPEEKRLDS